MKWLKDDFSGMNRFYRGNLVNSITGFKSLHLLGSISAAGIPNLAVFTQVIHLGADPALLGILFRPQVAGMHSLQNIRETGWLTLNHVLQGEELAAHWTSARWEIPEFEPSGLEPEYLEDIPVPFVKGSRVKLALQPVQEIPLEINGTTLLVASLQYLEIPDEALLEDGFVHLLKAGSQAGTGLDGYARIAGISRFSYARPGEKPRII